MRPPLVCWVNNKNLRVQNYEKRRKKEFVSVGDYQVPKQNKFSIALIVQGKCHTWMETSLFSNSNVLKACVNKIGNTQEKDEKSWRSIEKDYLEIFVLV